MQSLNYVSKRSHSVKIVGISFLDAYPKGLCLEVMSEKTKQVSQLADTTYAHTLVIKSTHEYS